MRIGVLALQGDVREHAAHLAAAGVSQVPKVRWTKDLDGLDGLIIPGGESTTMHKLLVAFEVFEPLRQAIADGLPVYGSCAGMIMLADRIVDGTSDQQTLGGIDMTVRRNAFGRQVDSYECPIDFDGISGGAVPGVFIRAPWVEEVGNAVTVLARTSNLGDSGGKIVAVRQGNLLATSFHPEVVADNRVHQYFVAMCQDARN